MTPPRDLASRCARAHNSQPRFALTGLVVLLIAAAYTGCGPKLPEPIDSPNKTQGTNNKPNATPGLPPLPPNALPAGDGIPGCGATWRAGDDLRVCTATYFGGPENDDASAIAILPDGSILIGGLFPETRDFGPAPQEFLLGGPGLIMRLDPSGKKITGWTRLGNGISTLATSPDGEHVVVTGTFGAASLSPDLGTLRWSTSTNAAKALAIANDGTAALLAGDTVTLLDTRGEGKIAIAIEGDYAEDVAISSEHGLVYVTGFTQLEDNLQTPFLRAYDFDGALVWRAWDFTTPQVGEASSDSRGYVVSMGLDRMLYFAGEAHGGETVFHKDPVDPTRDAPNHSFDQYSQISNLNGAAPVTYFAKFDPLDGDLIQGQFLAARLGSGKANSARVRWIEAREDGVVLMAGQSACCIPGSDVKTVAGQLAMPDYAGGAFVTALDPNFTQRLFWTTFTSDASAVLMRGIAIRRETMAMVQVQGEDRDMPGTLSGECILHDTIQDTPSGGTSEVHYSVWAGPGMISETRQ